MLPYDKYGHYEAVDGGKYGSVALLKCDNRTYKEHDGNLAIVKCGADGKWTTPQVSCSNGEHFF